MISDLSFWGLLRAVPFCTVTLRNTQSLHSKQRAFWEPEICLHHGIEVLFNLHLLYRRSRQVVCHPELGRDYSELSRGQHG